MLSPVQFIEVRGVKREVLITPSLNKVAHDRGLGVTVNSHPASIESGYIKLIYLGVLNYHEATKYTNPDLGECDVTLIDVEIWAALNPKEFQRLIPIVFELKMGRPLAEVAKEIQKETTEAEKKKNGRLLGIIRRIFS